MLPGFSFIRFRWIHIDDVSRTLFDCIRQFCLSTSSRHRHRTPTNKKKSSSAQLSDLYTQVKSLKQFFFFISRTLDVTYIVLLLLLFSTEFCVCRCCCFKYTISKWALEVFFLAASRSALETESLCFAASYVPMESARLLDLEYKVKSKLNFIISRMKSHSLSADTAAKQRSSRACSCLRWAFYEHLFFSSLAVFTPQIGRNILSADILTSRLTLTSALTFPSDALERWMLLCKLSRFSI